MSKLLVPIFLALLVIQSQDDEFIRGRLDMVKNQIESRGISHRATLDAMRSVPRHLFVPLDLQAQAYKDRPLPIGYGQTISQPFIVAFMTEVVKPNSKSKVLEIGSGSGYQAAILSQIVNQVYTVEIVPELGSQVKKKYQLQGYQNVRSKTDDGYYGWEGKPRASSERSPVPTTRPASLFARSMRTCVRSRAWRFWKVLLSRSSGSSPMSAM